MSTNSAIEWTDATWNPVRGCVKVSPGCAHCYAETFAERFRGVSGHPYEQGFDLRLVPDKLTEPLSWKKPRRVFVNSMSDLFQDGVPDDYIDRVFAVMALTPQHTYQVLTKRPERMRNYFITDTEEPRHGRIHRLNLQERIDDAAGDFGACHANVQQTSPARDAGIARAAIRTNGRSICAFANSRSRWQDSDRRRDALSATRR